MHGVWICTQQQLSYMFRDFSFLLAALFFCFRFSVCLLLSHSITFSIPSSSWSSSSRFSLKILDTVEWNGLTLFICYNFSTRSAILSAANNKLNVCMFFSLLLFASFFILSFACFGFVTFWRCQNHRVNDKVSVSQSIVFVFEFGALVLVADESKVLISQ